MGREGESEGGRAASCPPPASASVLILLSEDKVLCSRGKGACGCVSVRVRGGGCLRPG